MTFMTLLEINAILTIYRGYCCHFRRREIEKGCVEWKFPFTGEFFWGVSESKKSSHLMTLYFSDSIVLVYC